MADNNAPWFKQTAFWLLMMGPIIVVIAGFATFFVAKHTANDMVTDDYYKEGKHINMQIERDAEAIKRNIVAQVLFNDDGSAAKVFVSGDFDPEMPLNLLLLHPATQAYDQTISLKKTAVPASGNKTEYTAALQPLKAAVHWYVRVEDATGKWRVENKWLPSQGHAVELHAADNVLVNATASAASAVQ
ncbi:FixH family protein [Wielerella bovis]|uniref:FixH family protein n=1 Tax=Wielerella bovis TaxID=2917790 RepID=UPI00201A183E|nr:FixH family protein [Wielerella bovis]ULJ69851.1 FixH family protein [Wielerella bovis]